MDRESIVVDSTNGRFRNRIYIHGSSHARGGNGLTRSALTLYTSVDGGRSFDRPTEWVTFGRGHIDGPGNSVILSDGRWLAVYPKLTAYWDGADSAGHAAVAIPAPPDPRAHRSKPLRRTMGGLRSTHR